MAAHEILLEPCCLGVSRANHSGLEGLFRPLQCEWKVLVERLRLNLGKVSDWSSFNSTTVHPQGEPVLSTGSGPSVLHI